MRQPTTKHSWADIEGFEGFYQISASGRVKSVTRVVNGRTYHTRNMKISVQRQGYLGLGLHREGVGTSVLIHRLIAQAFIPNPNKLAEVLHIDGNKRNNCIDNLVWASKSDVQKNNWEKGFMNSMNHSRGEHRHMAKLTNKKVQEILKSADSTQQLAKQYGVSISTIKKVRQRRTWVHITA